jgi:hypothetical protein
LPAPIANRSSVAVADSDTIRRGARETVTDPFDAATVSGKPDPADGWVAVDDVDEPDDPHPASRAASSGANRPTSLRLDIKNLRI